MRPIRLQTLIADFANAAPLFYGMDVDGLLAHRKKRKIVDCVAKKDSDFNGAKASRRTESCWAESILE